jgi:hypothetical protein
MPCAGAVGPAATAAIGSTLHRRAEQRSRSVCPALGGVRPHRRQVTRARAATTPYCAVIPPSIARAAPVMKAASSLSR